MNDIPHLFKRLKEINHQIVGLTDHGALYNALSFYKKAIEEGVKPLIGCEYYVFHDHRLQSKDDIEALVAETGDDFIREEGHLVVLAKDFSGYQSLCRLTSLGFKEGFYRRPHVSYELLKEHKNGLIVIEGHIGTHSAIAIERSLYPPEGLSDKEKEEYSKRELKRAYDIIKRYREVFKDDFYLEIQWHGLEIEKQVNPIMIKIAKDLGIKLIASTDAHYTYKSDATAHRVLFANGIGKTYNQFMEGPYEGFTTCEEFYVKSDEEVIEAMSAFGEDGIQAVYNTVEVADKINIEIPYIEYGGSFVNAKGKTEHKWKTKDYLFPEVNVPVPYQSAEKYFEALALQGFVNRCENQEVDLETYTLDDYRNRLDYEIQVIKNMGFPTYFLILYDVVNFCHEQGIPVGKGRGSGAGSLVLYSLRITDVDPLKYQLLFERFLNPDRISMPDVDMDFCYNRIDEVIEYTRSRYGEDKVCKIGTFGTLGAKAVIKDVARVLEYSYDKINSITTKIHEMDLTVEKVENYDFVQEILKDDEDLQQVFSVAKRLEGLQRHTSQHAAGIVISPFPLTDLIPTKGSGINLTSQFTMGDLELLGFVKMDYLRLRTLTVIKNAVESIERHTGKYINIDKIDFTDDAVFEEFREGNSLCVFQFESTGMQALLKSMKPKSIDDLSVGNALYRPGALDATDDNPDSPTFGKTMVQVYVDRASGLVPVSYDHPLLEGVLSTTYGVFCFQEQIMQSSVALAGYTLSEADNLRKIIGKKLLDKIPVEREKFISGCLNNSKFTSQTSDPNTIANRIFDQIQTYGRYGFNRSHSTAYAILAYQSMWLKHYYPEHFMASVLTSLIGEKITKMVPYLNECRRMGIQLLPPDVNHSTARFEVSSNGEGIHFSLTGIDGVGKKAVENILELKERHQFKNLVDFITMTNSSVNKSVVSSLIRCGAFDFLGHNRKTMLVASEEIISIFQKIKTRINGNKKRKNPVSDISIFYEPLYEYQMQTQPEFDIVELCDMERQLTGFYIKHHPLDGLIEYIRNKSTNTSFEINEGIEITERFWTDDDGNERVESLEEPEYVKLPERQTVITGGVVGTVTIIPIKNGRSKGKEMVSFVIEDAYQGYVKCTAFADTYARFKSLIKQGNVIMIQGKISYYRDQAQINVENILPVNRQAVQNKKEQEINNRLYIINREIELAEKALEELENSIYDPDQIAELIVDITDELISLQEQRDLLLEGLSV